MAPQRQSALRRARGRIDSRWREGLNDREPVSSAMQKECSKMKASAILLMLASTFLLPAVLAETKPAATPTKNPFLADSGYPVSHGYTDFTWLKGPMGPTRQLSEDEIQWKKVGPINGYAPLISHPYPNGKRVVWVGGYDRMAKLDGDTFAVLSSYGLGGNTYFGEEEIDRHIAAMDAMSKEEVAAYEQNIWRESYKYVQSAYRMISRDNEVYMPRRYADGSVALQVFGDAIPGDPSSEIVLRREWRIPPELTTATIMSVNMTYDGWVVFVTQDGLLVALSRDLKAVKTLKLPRTGEEPAEANFFAAFVRNGLTMDDRMGIYVVTRDNLHRVQWTGSKLSLDEADGAWAVAYPNAIGIGSGTTPALMGWGDAEDHLVLITDGSKTSQLLAFWRDSIPEDWKGIPDYPRRVAGVTPVHFGVSKDEIIQVENAPIVMGYGTFINNFDNSFRNQHLDEEGGVIKERQEKSSYVHLPGNQAAGGTMIRWNPAARTLDTVWKTQVNFVNTVCTVSGPSSMVYCWGMRDKQWTLEGTDWETGKSAFHYVLGPSKRYDALGGPIIVGHDGDVVCACSGGLGLVRVKPREQ
jgi:hypothetical protein